MRQIYYYRPGYVLVAGLDGNMCPSVKLLTAADCGPDARMVLFPYEGLVEQLADHIALLTNLNDAAVAGIVVTINPMKR